MEQIKQIEQIKQTKQTKQTIVISDKKFLEKQWTERLNLILESDGGLE